jgi:DNA-binding MarR family transcriptional regulator
MWLPKNERKTLSFYYQETDAGAGSITYFSDKPTDLINHLSNETKSAKGHQITPQTIKEINRRLENLGLIKTQNILAREIKIELTPEGLRLGQKFNSLWLCSNLWYAEYIKNHWICVIISFIGGYSCHIVGTVDIKGFCLNNRVRIFA